MLTRRYFPTVKYPSWNIRQTLRRIVPPLAVLVPGLVGAWLILTHWHTPPEAVAYPAKAYTDRAWTLVGIGLFCLALTLNRRTFRPRPLTIRPPARGITLITSSFIGVYILFWLSVQISPGLKVGGYLIGPAALTMRPFKQLAYFSLGIILFLLGMLRPGDPTAIRHTLRDSFRQQRREWLLVIGLTGIALAVRLYRLGSLFPVMYSDETLFYYPARLAADGRPISMLSITWGDQTYLGAFVLGLSTKVFGATLYAGRFVPAVMGTLAIPGVYLMARRLLNPLAGILAALFLTFQPVHVYFSRTLLYQPFDPTLEIYAALLIWSGLEHGERWKFALAGVLIGISQYLYTSGRLWLILVPLWLAVLFLRQPRAILRHSINLLVLALAVAAIMIPMMPAIRVGTLSLTQQSYNMSHGYGNSGRILDVSFKEYVFDWLSPAINVFYDQGDASMHYEMRPHTALNLRLAFLVFAMGIAYTLCYALNPRVLLVLMWMGLTVIFGGSLMHYIGHTRYLTATLPMAVIAGVGIVWFAQSGRRWLPGRYQPLTTVLAIALITAVSLQNGYFTFVTHPERLLNEFPPEKWIADALTKATLETPKENSTIYWIGTPYAWNTRMMEDYGYFNGKIDYTYWEVPFQQQWLFAFGQNKSAHAVRQWAAVLDTSRDIYIFVPPVRDDSPDPQQPFAPDSLIWPLLDAFPQAQITRYDGRIYPTDQPVALYARMYIPAGSRNWARR